jgi:peptide/nickel transport system permease protein
VTKFLLRRFAQSLLLVFLVLTATFFLIRLVPGDPTSGLESSRLTATQRDHLRHLYGIDRPLGVQYVDWLGAVALRADWGTSLSHLRPVTAVIADALPATILLSAAAIVIQYGLGLFLGMVAARRQNRFVDHFIRVGSLLVFSQPPFWLGLMAILVFSYRLDLLPPGHMHAVDAASFSWWGRQLDLLTHLILPASVLGVPGAARVARFVRASLLEVLSSDFVRTARAKGLSERRVLWVHALRPALAPVIQDFANTFSELLSGSLITEVVFAWPGVGRLAFGAIQARDYPLILAATALTGILVVAGNFLADLLHAAADPRVRTRHA